MKTWCRELDLKKKMALVLAPGALALGADAAVAHFAGRPPQHPAQLVPVLFAPLAALLLGWAAQRSRAEATGRRVLRTVGALSLLVGGAGTTFHLRALARLMEAPFSLRDLTAALAVAPPLFAPAAFAGLGALLWALGSPHLLLSLQKDRPEVGAPLPRTA